MKAKKNFFQSGDVQWADHMDAMESQGPPWVPGSVERPGQEAPGSIPAWPKNFFQSEDAQWADHMDATKSQGPPWVPVSAERPGQEAPGSIPVYPKKLFSK